MGGLLSAEKKKKEEKKKKKESVGASFGRGQACREREREI